MIIIIRFTERRCIRTKTKNLLEFLKDKYRNYKYPATLPKSMISRLSLENIFEEDIAEYEEYLQRIEEVKTIPKYSL